MSSWVSLMVTARFALGLLLAAAALPLLAQVTDRKAPPVAATAPGATVPPGAPVPGVTAPPGPPPPAPAADAPRPPPAPLGVPRLPGAPPVRAPEPQAPQPEAAKPPVPGATPPAVIAPAPPAAPPPAAAPAAPRPPVKPGRTIALIVPSESPPLARHAAALREGFAAGLALTANPESVGVRVIGTGAEPAEILAAYKEAVHGGASVVVGPLLREQVATLAASGLASVPTLALNMLDGEPRLVPYIWQFGLNVEAEARQVARQVLREGRQRALLIVQPTTIGKRIATAFADAYAQGGGKVVAQLPIASEVPGLLRLRDQATLAIAKGAEVVFLAADAGGARLVRPYLDQGFPTWATSQVAGGRAEAIHNHDLNGIRLLDMPWLLEPDHPAVMVYARPPQPLSAELERVYALGIDAARLAEMLLDRPLGPALSVDGVSGRLTLDRGNVIAREPLPARFVNGLPALERR